MKRTILFLTFAISGISFAKVEAGLEELRDTQFQCEVVSVTETRDGEIEGSTKEGLVLMATRNQNGGDQYTDAKCFHTPMIGKNGKETSMSYGCLEMSTKNIKKFDAEELLIKRKEANYSSKETVKINFKTGEGSRSYYTRLCGWGWDCTTAEGEAIYKNCVILK